jgi:hypothetical protein
MPGGFGFGPIRPWRTAGTPPALSPQRDPGASPRLAKSGRPLQCPSRTLHVSHERVSFTFPNCYAVDNGPGYPGHRVSYLFQTCRQPGPADPPERGCGGPGRRGQNGLVCPGWPPARKKLDPRHAGLGRVSAGRGAARLAGPGFPAGSRGRRWGRVRAWARGRTAGERAAGYVAGPPRRPAAGASDIQPRQPLHSCWPRPRGSRPRLFTPAQDGAR